MLEQKIEALTAAVTKLTVVMGGMPQPMPQTADTGARNGEMAAVIGAAKVAKPAKAKVAPPEVENLEAPRILEYDDVKEPFIAFIESKGHEAAAALLAKFGVAKLPALPPEKFEAMLAAIAEAS